MLEVGSISFSSAPSQLCCAVFESSDWAYWKNSSQEDCFHRGVDVGYGYGYWWLGIIP